MTPQDDHGEQPQPTHKLTWLWMLFALLVAGLAMWALWWWKQHQPPVGGVCQPDSLALSQRPADGTAGTLYVHVVLTNTGNSACTLSGYPVVSVLDAKGENHFTGDAQQNNVFAPTTITLAPHDTAHAVVGFPDKANFEPGVCLTDSVTLRVYVPQTTITPGVSALTTPTTLAACPGLSVTALQPGA